MPLVLLAVDETEESVAAARRARELFGPDATYLAVNVGDEPVSWLPVADLAWGEVYGYVPPYPAVEDDIVENLQDIRVDSATSVSPGTVADRARDVADAAATEAGVRAYAVGTIGDPVEAIVRAAAERSVDVIVVGSSHKGWWRRLLDGSIADELIHTASRPVLVVSTEEGRS